MVGILSAGQLSLGEHKRGISQGIPAVIFPSSYTSTTHLLLPPLMEPQTCRKVARIPVFLAGGQKKP